MSNENACSAAIRSRYLWPDTNPDTYRQMPVTLSLDTTNKGRWQPLSLADSTDDGITLASVDIATRTVRANFPALGHAAARVIARVEPANVVAQLGGQPTYVIPAGTKEIIDLCGLNTTRSSRVAYDRRGLNRTRAWLLAVDTLRRLRQCATLADFDVLWPQVGMTAVAAGFFSVWLRVLSAGTDPSGTALDALFVADFAADFPGTNTTSLP
jgi:hypothetical protein